MASLRTMVLRDLDEIEILEEALFGSSAWSRKAYEAELSDNPFSHYAVIEKNGEIVGYCGYMALYENAEVLTIGVSSAFQNQGYGALMMAWMINEAKGAGAEHMSLEVRVSNQPALKLYQRFGFQKAAIRSRYYQDGEDAILMIKRLEA